MLECNHLTDRVPDPRMDDECQEEADEDEDGDELPVVDPLDMHDAGWVLWSPHLDSCPCSGFPSADLVWVAPGPPCLRRSPAGTGSEFLP